MLRILVDGHRVLSDQPVELLRGADRITANQLDYSDRERVAILTGRVRAQLVAAPPARSRASAEVRKHAKGQP
jgi:hypothetical protein